jgi:transcriptional regulator with XRE-family HTH domain
MTNWLFPSLLSLCLPPFLFGYLDGFKTRSRAKLSSRDLQDKAKISDVTLAKIKNGTQRPRPATIGRIAAALGVDPAEIIEQEA